MNNLSPFVAPTGLPLIIYPGTLQDYACFTFVIMLLYFTLE